MTISRNDPCPCGSGVKYKKCCMGKKKPLSAKVVTGSSAVASLMGRVKQVSAATQPSAFKMTDHDYRVQ